MIEVLLITDTRQVDNLVNVFKRLARYDGKEFTLTKHEKIKEKRSPQGSRKSMGSPFIPPREFLQDMAGIMGQEYGSIPSAFTDKLFRGGFAPQRGTDAYNVYLVAQKQRLAHFLKNADMFADPKRILNTKKGRMIANYDNKVRLFRDDRQLGSFLNKTLTDI